MKKVLITGGAGFIGSHLARRLCDEGAELVLADNFSRGTHDPELAALAERDQVRVVTADLTDPAGFDSLGTGFDEVYHLAAILGVENVLRHPARVLRVNLLSTLNLLDWMTRGGGQKLFFSSTSEVYAWTKQFAEIPVPTPEEVPLSLTDLRNPRATYAGSKITGELAVHHYAEEGGFPYVIVRYHNVYGPRMGMDHVIPQIYDRLRRGERPLAVRSPEHRRAFCYVDDALDLSIAAMRSEACAGVTLNAGNDAEEVSIRELAEKIVAWSGEDVALTGVAAENDPIQRRCPDMSRARELLDYQPRFSLEAGLDRILSWYQTNVTFPA